MGKIEIEGMHRLQGEVRVQGSKNAALPILSACVLSEGETVLFNCPKISDVFSMLDALSGAGAKISWEGDDLYIKTTEMHPVPFIEKAGSMRSSIMLLGSFLGRFKKATVGYPGGCCIGKRPIDLHKQALGAMGVNFREEENYLEANAKNLEGCDLYLPYPSVGVTENIILAAAGASGMTRIYGAAREPEIVELCRFLTAMGIRISGIGTETIIIMGDKRKKHVEYKISSDRIVAGTYLFATVAAGGTVVLKDAPLEHMKTTIQVTGKLGADLYRSGNDIKIEMKHKPEPIKFIRTAPYPGFPTDLQSPLLAVLSKAQGESCVEERLFENRFLVVKDLCRMGAEISLYNQTAIIKGVKRLCGSHLTVQELRGGAALVIAALSAEGNSCLEGAELILRGYENISGDLQALGAVINPVE